MRSAPVVIVIAFVVAASMGASGCEKKLTVVSQACPADHRYTREREVELCLLDGQRDGPYAIWYDEELSSVRYLGRYRRDVPTGRWQVYWRRSGDRAAQLAAEGDFVDGRRHGRWVSYEEHGTKIAEGVYDAGRRVGAWSFWHPDGTLWKSGSFEADVASGDWTYASGTLRGTGRCHAGAPVRESWQCATGDAPAAPCSGFWAGSFEGVWNGVCGAPVVATPDHLPPVPSLE